jgi:hypothetical protein
MKQSVYGIKGLNKTLRSLPEEAGDQMRVASKEIADDVASEAATRARGGNAAARLVAGALSTPSSRIPTVKLGGSRKLAPHSGGRARRGKRQTVGEVIWGAEFGGGRRPSTTQFAPHRGRQGYFLWPTIRANSRDIKARYSRALDKALQEL